MLAQLQQHLDEGKTAEYGWDQVISHAIDILKQSNNTLLIERITDLKDLRNQVLEHVSGIEIHCHMNIRSAQVLKSISHKSVVIRLLDTGGDKNINYLKMLKKRNPALGV